MTADHDGRRSGARAGRFVVVSGAPEDSLVTTLRAVGLAPIAADGDVVVWAKPPPPPVQPGPPPDRHGTGPAGLLLTIADAARALGLGRSTVYELIGRGELEVVHIGRSARVPVAAVHALVERVRARETA